MSKVEELAAKYATVERSDGEGGIDITSYVAFIDGYKQAEKDNELTWEDIRLIDIIAAKFAAEHGEWAYRKRHYEEILEQFLERKGGKV